MAQENTVTPEQIDIWPENDIGIERYISQKERDSIADEDFAGPHQSFPIRNQDDVNNAARLIGHADDPDAVKRKIIAIAKRKNLSIPDSWKDDKDSERAAQAEELPSTEAPQVEATERTQTPEPPTTAMLFAPITRIDKNDWIVEGVATSEEVDSFGTIFSFEASKRAFQNWSERNANVREMHDKKAVGKGIYWWPEEDSKQIHVRCKVSRGAPDTWQKVLDAVLCGFSVGAVRTKWGSVTRNGKTYPYLEDYDLAELSLVDNPSNPDCNFALCRADGLTDVVDVTEPEQTSSTGSLSSSESEPSVSAVATSSPDLERAGARISSDTRTGLHEARDYQMHGAMKTMKTCDCPDCQAMLLAIDPDNDGDIDLTDGPADTDHDADALAERVMQLVEARLQEMLTRIQLPIQRMQTIAGTFAQSHAQDIDLSPLQQKVDTIVERLDTVPNQSSLDEVRSALAEVKGQVEKIAAQPVSGGPVMSAAAVDPRFGHTQQSPLSEEEQELRMLERLKESGKLNNHELQTAAAARAIRRWQ